MTTFIGIATAILIIAAGWRPDDGWQFWFIVGVALANFAAGALTERWRR